MSSSFSVMFALFPVFIWLISMAAAVAIYVFRSLGLYQMAKNTAMANPWLAWIPVAHDYLAGKMADRYTATQGRKTRYAFWNVLWLGVAMGIYILFFAVIFGVIFGMIFSEEMGRSRGYHSDGSAMAGILVLAIIVMYVLLFVVIITAAVFRCIAHYYLYCDFEPNQKALHTVLTVFGLDCVSKMILRNNVPVGIAGHYPGGQPKYK